MDEMAPDDDADRKSAADLAPLKPTSAHIELQLVSGGAAKHSGEKTGHAPTVAARMLAAS